MSNASHTAFLSTGTNLGDGFSNLRMANRLLDQHAGRIVAASPVYRTAPWGVPDQADYLNQALCIETGYTPQELLHCLQNIEQYMGRIRDTRWGSRVIDLDLIFFDDLIVRDPGLTVPHPRMRERNFVLIPLHDIAPDWVHPETGQTVRQLLRDTTDILAVQRADLTPSKP